MQSKVKASVKSISSSLHRLLLHPANARLDGECFYEDDESLFRERGLDIQDFAPSYIDVHQYATRKDEENNILVEEQLQPEFQVFAYSFSYLPDPTWLVNWENGSTMEEVFESEMIELHDHYKSLELDMGEYLTGVVTELMENDGDREGCLYILSLITNKNRELIINKRSKSRRQYKLQLPDGYGIIGRFPAPRYSFGFYVGWMIPKQWSIRTHLWFPDRFRKIVLTVLLTFHRIASSREDAHSSTDEALCALPPSVIQNIIQRWSLSEQMLPSDEMKTSNWKFIQEIE